MMDNLKIIKLLPEHASQVAELQISGISTSFISSLGNDFIQALYEAIAKSTVGFGFVAEENGMVLGFVAFTTNIHSLYKSIIPKKAVRFAFILTAKMFSLQRIKKIFETLFYPTRMKKMNLPSAELLAIVIAPEHRRKGLAMRLVRKGFQQCQERGIERVKVLVATDNKPGNKLYQKCGFDLIGQVSSHGIVSNIYVAQTNPVRSR